MFQFYQNIFLLVILILAIVLSLVLLSNRPKEESFPPQKENQQSEQPTAQPVVIAKNLQIPWALAFLPDGQILVTERLGKVKLIDQTGQAAPILVAEISEVKHLGEGGLLGLTLHPDFLHNHYLYLYYTYLTSGDNTLNKVVRFEYQNGQLQKPRVIIDQIPGALNHNGGRLKFGPDNFLYITTGDAQNPSLAQTLNSLAGKILRVTGEGQAAPGNPFNNLIFSFGHRNPQGLAWDSKGQLWASEHGPSGNDELNQIEAGKNYGWPIIQGDQSKEGMVSPLLFSGSQTWAPAGLAFFNDSLFFGGLRGNALYEAKISTSPIILNKHLATQHGRIREVILGPDNNLYLTTSNLDGRGQPQVGDDQIIKINPISL